MQKTEEQILYRSFLQSNFRLATIFLASLVAIGCASAPRGQDDYALARAALEAAREVDSARFDPGNWQQAQLEYSKAEQAFKDDDYDQAIEGFRKARFYAEKAESNTQILRFKGGEVL